MKQSNQNCRHNTCKGPADAAVVPDGTTAAIRLPSHPENQSREQVIRSFATQALKIISLKKQVKLKGHNKGLKILSLMKVLDEFERNPGYGIGCRWMAEARNDTMSKNTVSQCLRDYEAIGIITCTAKAQWSPYGQAAGTNKAARWSLNSDVLKAIRSAKTKSIDWTRLQDKNFDKTTPEREKQEDSRLKTQVKVLSAVTPHVDDEKGGCGTPILTTVDYSSLPFREREVLNVPHPVAIQKTETAIDNTRSNTPSPSP